MAENKNDATYKFILPGVKAPESTSRSLGPAMRSGASAVNELLHSMEVKQHFDLSPTSRAAAGGQEIQLEASADDILALEMDDGFIFYTSAQRLAEDIERLDPDAIVGDTARVDALRAPSLSGTAEARFSRRCTP